MKLIKPSFEIINQECGLNGIYKQIELAGRTCYKSEDKITETSAKEFVDRMVKSGHGAMLEHGAIYLSIPYIGYRGISSCKLAAKYQKNKYSKVIEGYKNFTIVTNYRVLVENNWLKDLKYIDDCRAFNIKRITVKFICDRGITHELVRHRVFSFAQESTRYCNYSKDKFGNELTFIIPNWINLDEGRYEFDSENSINSSAYNWINNMCNQEDVYLDLLENGWSPQQARSVLPNSLKSEIIMTGFIEDWKHFFKLRCAETAHPQMRELAIPLQEEFIKLKLI